MSIFHSSSSSHRVVVDEDPFGGSAFETSTTNNAFGDDAFGGDAFGGANAFGGDAFGSVPTTDQNDGKKERNWWI